MMPQSYLVWNAIKRVL
ncbi:hypothetical protein [Methanocaldococcus sp.]